jgi:predicted MFS family arabinose efflux permease
LPAVLASFVLMVPAIIYAEKRGAMKPVFIAAVALLLLTQFGFWLANGSFWATAAMLLLFFVSFNILEASLPSMISRIAPARAKGAALGVYNTTQALGLALGGVLGGVLAKRVGFEAVFLFNAALALVWLFIAASMAPLPRRAGHGGGATPAAASVSGSN